MSDPSTPPTDPAAQPAVPLVVGRAPEYEFTPEQDKVIDNLADGIRWVRVPLVVVAVLQLVIAAVLAVEMQTFWAPRAIVVVVHLLAAIFFFMLAGWLQRAATSFDRVTHTTGRDITNVLLGLRNLALWFGLLGWIVKVYLILLGLMVIALMIRLVSGGAGI